MLGITYDKFPHIIKEYYQTPISEVIEIIDEITSPNKAQTKTVPECLTRIYSPSHLNFLQPTTDNQATSRNIARYRSLSTRMPDIPQFKPGNRNHQTFKPVSNPYQGAHNTGNSL
ncbi:hypothetical protein CEXT_353601 [Caerostris extrusa]|uniref:Uncharacterized protein n=1 Tax=Caerostris extrusa TaxID=172846 RepID=A0AAV4QQN2_CAEEX|nr:hypothetical protein CEXT_353601 [Caerostris extrusa]